MGRQQNQRKVIRPLEPQMMRRASRHEDFDRTHNSSSQCAGIPAFRTRNCTLSSGIHKWACFNLIRNFKIDFSEVKRNCQSRISEHSCGPSQTSILRFLKGLPAFARVSAASFATQAQPSACSLLPLASVLLRLP
jgi:hypothetical protein